MVGVFLNDAQAVQGQRNRLFIVQFTREREAFFQSLPRCPGLSRKNRGDPDLPLDKDERSRVLQHADQRQGLFKEGFRLQVVAEPHGDPSQVGECLSHAPVILQGPRRAERQDQV